MVALTISIKKNGEKNSITNYVVTRVSADSVRMICNPLHLQFCLIVGYWISFEHRKKKFRKRKWMSKCGGAPWEASDILAGVAFTNTEWLCQTTHANWLDFLDLCATHSRNIRITTCGASVGAATGHWHGVRQSCENLSTHIGLRSHVCTKVMVLFDFFLKRPAKNLLFAVASKTKTEIESIILWIMTTIRLLDMRSNI